MDLPKIELPIYELKLPSNDQIVRVRPFTVKEEKLLLMAVQSNEIMDIINTTKQIITNCLVDNDVDINKLPFFDIDYLFIALRAKSIGETITVNYICKEPALDKFGLMNDTCDGTIPFVIDINNADVVKPMPSPSNIDVGGDVIFKLKYPNYTVMKQLSDKDTALTNKIRVITFCADQIMQGKKVWSMKDQSKETIHNYIEGLTQESFAKLAAFVDNLPYFYIKAESKCTKCGKEHKIEFKDFQRFFL